MRAECYIGVTYVNHHTKCVFNGSELGKQYSAKAIQERCRNKENISPKKAEFSHPVADVSEPGLPTVKEEKGGNALMDTLFQPENTSVNIPNQLTRKGKKKKKKKNSNEM